MPVLTAATTEDTGGAAEEAGADPREMFQTAFELVRLWFVAIFSTIVTVAMLLEVEWMAEAPGGYLFFWGALMLVGGYYATTRTPKVLGWNR